MSSFLLFINTSSFPFRSFVLLFPRLLCFLIFHSHDITELCSRQTRCSCGSLLSLHLLSSFPNQQRPLPRKHCHVTLRISNRGNWLLLFRENMSSIQKRRFKIMH